MSTGYCHIQFFWVDLVWVLAHIHAFIQLISQGGPFAGSKNWNKYLCYCISLNECFISQLELATCVEQIFPEVVCMLFDMPHVGSHAMLFFLSINFTFPVFLFQSRGSNRNLRFLPHEKPKSEQNTSNNGFQNTGDLPISDNDPKETKE